MEPTGTAAVNSADPSAPVNLADLIVKTPGTCGGRARIAGTRIKVEQVYSWVERQGMSPAQVVKEYPHVTMAQVHAALAYYWSHQDEIQRDIAEGEARVAQMKAEAGPSKLAQRLADLDAQDDSLPPG